MAPLDVEVGLSAPPTPGAPTRGIEWLIAARPLRTRYLQADPAYAHVSSTLLRARCLAGEPIAELVPEAIEGAVRRAYGKGG